YPRALKWAEESLQIARESEDRVQEAACLELRSFIWIDLGHYSRALQGCLEALSILQDAPDSRIENICQRTLGVVQLEIGNLSAARECLEKSLQSYEREHDLRGQDVCLYWLTLLHRDRGDYSRAMECAKQALWISRRIGFKTAEAFHLTTIGDIYLALGHYERALDFNKQALRVTEQYVSKWSREECLNTIGYVYLELKDYPQALTYFEEALDYIKRIGHRREEARCLHNIGVAHLNLEHYGTAQTYFLESLRTAELNGNRMIVALNFNRLGVLNRLQGRIAAARAYHERGRAIGREIGQPAIIWEALAGLGAVSVQENKSAQAISFYKAAVDVIEDIRHQLPLREHSSGFFKSKITLYEELVNVLYEQHLADPTAAYGEECFFYAERAKARSFLDDLQKAKIDLDSIPLSPEKKERLDMLSKQISHILSELNRPSTEPKGRAALLRDLEKAEDDFQELIETARRQSPHDLAPLFRPPSPFHQIREKFLDEKTAVIEYFVGEENIFIFSLTAQGLDVSRIKPPRSRELLDLAQNYIKLISSRDISGEDCAFPGRKLGEQLLAAGRDFPPAAVKNLIVIPDRQLCYLAFEALVLPQNECREAGAAARFLLEKYEISYAPSASALVQIMERGSRATARKDLLAVGDPFFPDLPAGSSAYRSAKEFTQEYYLEGRFCLYPLSFASKEMKSISRFFRREEKTVISREQATEENVKRLPLAEYGIVHFATHGLLDERVACRSALVLTFDGNTEEDGFLQAREVYNLSLNAGLVVLSACQTGRGKMEKGDGIQGIARAFFCAGTRAVLASLWDINDRSTALFMKYFYDYLTQGKSKQEALRLSKVRMIRSRYHHPYHWAGFVLFGEGRSSLEVERASLWRRVFAF
ncbi:MAG: CHAT domain-containing tetratricopeptide repeat protein, partial [Acidobacteriota bacterium]